MILDLNSSKTHIVVAGGGTAGWLTALWMRNNYPDVKITVIKSEEIGILGAGEGTTPQFITFLEDIGIPFPEIVRYAKGTLKNGIKFSNWLGDKSSYFHGFTEMEDLNPQIFAINNSHLPLLCLEEIGNGKNLDSINFSSIISNLNSVKFAVNSNIKTNSTDPLSYFKSLGSFALHFNANLLAEYLEKKGKTRNIDVINGTIKTVNSDNDGFITSLVLEDKSNVYCNFVFDCTGFKRLILGKHFKTKFKSYKKFLPVKKAMPFFIKINEEDEFPPYTEATAMKYGWSWKIPVSDRFGCGYVYDSDMVSDDEIKKEIDEVTGTDTSIPKTFSFEPGVYEKVWVKNCVGIGLAYGFVEPLEATSIHQTIVLLKRLFLSSSGIVYRNDKEIEHLNKQALKISDEIMTFIHAHYITKRNDTIFWKEFRKNNKLPERLDTFFKNGSRVSTIRDDLIDAEIFASYSWLQVGSGLNLFDKEDAKQNFLSINSGARISSYVFRKRRFLTNLDLVATTATTHRSFLNYISDY